MKRINVMHISYSLEVGGAEAVILGLLSTLDRRQFGASVCSFQPGGEMMSRFLERGIPVHVVPKRSGKDWRLPLRLAKLFRKEKVDIVHSHNSYQWLYSTLAAKTVGVRGVILTEHANVRNPTFLLLSLSRLVQFLTDRITVNSEQVKHALMRHGISASRISVIRNGIDAKQYFASDSATKRYAEAMGLSETDIVIGMVARLAPPKDFVTLFQAIEHLRGEGKEPILLIIGTGRDEQRVRNCAARMGLDKQVRFLGSRNDVIPLLSVMDLFVLSSLKEGQSMSIMEAMAMGLPVVATETGGTPELVEHGKTGILVPPKDHLAMARALALLMDDRELRTRLGRAGQQVIREKYAIETITAEYESLYRSICGAGSPFRQQ